MLIRCLVMQRSPAPIPRPSGRSGSVGHHPCTAHDPPPSTSSTSVTPHDGTWCCSVKQALSPVEILDRNRELLRRVAQHFHVAERLYLGGAAVDIVADGLIVVVVDNLLANARI